jgi:hypothetical protein
MMDITGKARKLERRISRTVDAAVEEFMGRGVTAPLEIIQAVVDRAEHEIQDIVCSSSAPRATKRVAHGSRPSSKGRRR